ncbi:sulfite exporter TauE/SafE family protein [Halobacillus seohaensis]
MADLKVGITMDVLLLFFIGLFSGAYGIMVGAGGGFIFVPALLLLFQMSPAMAAGTGLLVVLINSVSGLYGYVRQHRIEYNIGIWLSLGAIPGSVIGVWLATIIPVNYFHGIFAIVLIGLGLFLFIKKAPVKTSDSLDGEEGKTSIPMFPMIGFGIVMGVVSTFFGIGGGWLIVPVLIYLFKMSPHKATATSIFSLSLYSAVGVGIHLYYDHIVWSTALIGGAGAFLGAQIGVYASNRVSGKLLIQLLSILLIIIGVRMFF